MNFHKLKCNLHHIYFDSEHSFLDQNKTFQDIYVSDNANVPEYLYYHYYSNHWRWTISKFLTPVFAIEGGETSYVSNFTVSETGQIIQRIGHNLYCYICDIYIYDVDNNDAINSTRFYRQQFCVSPNPQKVLRLKRRNGVVEYPGYTLYWGGVYLEQIWRTLKNIRDDSDTININVIYPRWESSVYGGCNGIFTPVANSGASTRYIGREVYKDQHGGEYRKNNGTFDLIRENANHVFIIGTERKYTDRAREVGWYEGSTLPTKTTPANFVKHKFVGTDKTAFPDDTLTLTYNKLEFKGFEEPSYVFNVETWL